MLYLQVKSSFAWYFFYRNNTDFVILRSREIYMKIPPDGAFDKIDFIAGMPYYGKVKLPKFL